MNVDPIRVFWMPGCSACVKAKEFLTSLDVPFESVNVLADEQGAADLERLGARSLPVVSRGDKFVFAQSLDQISEFVGKKRVAEKRLPPEELIQRWQTFLALAESLTADIPDDKLDHRPVPTRDRSLLALAYHVFQIPDVFVRNAEGEFEDWAHYVNLPPPESVESTADVLDFAKASVASLTQWWTSLGDWTCSFPVATYYGVRPAWELLERQTWHTAQHVRQIDVVLSDFSVPLARNVDPQLYVGLPMPAGLWE